MKKTIEVQQCDNPGCERKVFPADEGLYLGYTGTVSYHDARGGVGGLEWFACSSKCVKPAVEEAIDRTMRHE